MALLYLVLVFAACFPGYLHPALWAYFPVIAALVAVFPFFWIAARWQSFGVGTVLGVVLCLFCLVSGEAQGFWPKAMMVLGGVVADAVRCVLGNGSKRAIYAAYPLLIIGTAGWIVRLWTQPQWYYDNAVEEMGKTYADTLIGYSGIGGFLLLVVLIVAASVAGVWIAARLMKKSNEMLQ